MSRRNDQPEIFKIWHNKTTGAVPLVAGFYLEGPTIAHIKKWYFKNEQTGDPPQPTINHNLVQNHTFWKPGNYSVWVELVKIDREEVIMKSKSIPFTVLPKPRYITSFNQWEAVIYGGDDIGFSISHDLQNPVITWDWGDKKTDSKINPHHPYSHVNNPTVYEGKLCVYENEEKQVSRDFSVLVIPNPIKDVSGYMEVGNPQGPKNGFPVNHEINFQVHAKGKKFETAKWKFGDGSDPRYSEEPFTTYKYQNSGHYHIECILTDKYNRTLSMDKSLIIK